MLANGLLQKFLEKSLTHKGKLQSVKEAVKSLLLHNQLTLSGIARNINNKNKTKSNINKMDRLIGGSSLHREKDRIYTLMCQRLIDTNRKPVISIDWSDTPPSSETHWLCATVSICNRGFVCYEKTYPKEQYNSKVAHKDFINQLGNILPRDCKPVIVTDAASSFGVHWFHLIEAKGWFWVGRVRLGGKYFFIENSWHTVKDIFESATKKIKHYKNCAFTKRHQFRCNITIIKKLTQVNKNRTYATRRSHRHTTSKHKKRGHEPWVLVSSPELDITQNIIVDIYATRMSIEERFRDTKDPNYGSGLLNSRSRDPRRIESLLVLDAIARYILLIIGLVSEKKGLAKEFQSNTISKRRVLSIIRLAREVIRKGRIRLRPGEIFAAKQEIKMEAYHVPAYL